MPHEGLRGLSHFVVELKKDKHSGPLAFRPEEASS